jgi:hypothetical protein
VLKGDRACFTLPVHEPLRLCAAAPGTRLWKQAKPPSPPPPIGPEEWPWADDLDARQLPGNAYGVAPPGDAIFAELRKRGEEPIVIMRLQICVDADGKVAGVISKRATGFPDYEKAVTDSVQRTFRDAPAKDGSPRCIVTENVFMPPIELRLD